MQAKLACESFGHMVDISVRTVLANLDYQRVGFKELDPISNLLRERKVTYIMLRLPREVEESHATRPGRGGWRGGNSRCKVVVLRGRVLGARFMAELRRGSKPAQRRIAGRDVSGAVALPAFSWVTIICNTVISGKTIEIPSFHFS
jgi:hypothetical protein